MKSDQWIIQVGPYKIAIDRTFGNHPAIYDGSKQPDLFVHVSDMSNLKDAPVILFGHLVGDSPK